MPAPNDRRVAPLPTGTYRVTERVVFVGGANGGPKTVITIDTILCFSCRTNYHPERVECRHAFMPDHGVGVQHWRQVSGTKGKFSIEELLATLSVDCAQIMARGSA